MSKLLQLQILREEEKVLKDIEAKLKDQLNRLKVEELTLKNQLRSGEEQPVAEKDQTSQFSIQIYNQPGSAQNLVVEDASSMNVKPLDDLEVNSQLLWIDKNEEMEEEEEEDEGTDQLTAFVKQLESNNS